SAHGGPSSSLRRARPIRGLERTPLGRSRTRPHTHTEARPAEQQCSARSRGRHRRLQLPHRHLRSRDRHHLGPRRGLPRGGEGPPRASRNLREARSLGQRGSLDHEHAGRRLIAPSRKGPPRGSRTDRAPAHQGRRLHGFPGRRTCSRHPRRRPPRTHSILCRDGKPQPALHPAGSPAGTRRGNRPGLHRRRHLVRGPDVHEAGYPRRHRRPRTRRLSRHRRRSRPRTCTHRHAQPQ
ncbi:uncharacterized protein METZ01_LOCUS494944, partial [marine metagenome]